jgi:hypothetical protein
VGLHSPAFFLDAAQAICVPVDDVALVLDPSAVPVFPPQLRAGGPGAVATGGDYAYADGDDDEGGAAALSVVGQLVGLCCSQRHSPHAARAVRACELPCIGVAYVRDYAAASRELQLVTPVPLAALAQAGVDALVAWVGNNDVPSQLLYRDAPAGDAFAFVAAAAAPTRAAAARSGFARKNLKRRALGE